MPAHSHVDCTGCWRFAGAARGQVVMEFRNLRVLPENIGQDSLIQIMRSFSFATGLRCEGCHVFDEGAAFEKQRFDLDDKATKRKARSMVELRSILDEQGVAAAIERYRLLRQRATLTGAYDFREWEMNELAREAAAAGNASAARAAQQHSGQATTSAAL